MEFIRTYTAEKGYAPAFAEFIDAGLCSATSVVAYNLWQLRDAGVVAYEDGKARTVRVIETYSKAERGGDTSPTPAVRPQGGQE